jgi:hypothetical protein
MEKNFSNIDPMSLINYGIFYSYNIFNHDYITFLFYSSGIKCEVDKPNLNVITLFEENIIGLYILYIL